MFVSDTLIRVGDDATVRELARLMAAEGVGPGGNRGRSGSWHQRRLSAASVPLSRRASQTGRIETATRITARRR